MLCGFSYDRKLTSASRLIRRQCSGVFPLDAASHLVAAVIVIRPLGEILVVLVADEQRHLPARELTTPLDPQQQVVAIQIERRAAERALIQKIEYGEPQQKHGRVPVGRDQRQRRRDDAPLQELLLPTSMWS